MAVGSKSPNSCYFTSTKGTDWAWGGVSWKMKKVTSPSLPEVFPSQSWRHNTAPQSSQCGLCDE